MVLILRSGDDNLVVPDGVKHGIALDVKLETVPGPTSLIPKFGKDYKGPIMIMPNG